MVKRAHPIEKIIFQFNYGETLKLLTCWIRICLSVLKIAALPNMTFLLSQPTLLHITGTSHHPTLPSRHSIWRTGLTTAGSLVASYR